jgi:hypothetical protein
VAVECGPGCGCPYIAGLFLPGPRVTPLCPARNSGETVRLQQPGLLSSPEMSCSCRPARPRGDGDTVTRGRRGRGPPSPSLQVHMASPQGDGDTGLQGWGHSEPGGGGCLGRSGCWGSPPWWCRWRVTPTGNAVPRAASPPSPGSRCSDSVPLEGQRGPPALSSEAGCTPSAFSLFCFLRCWGLNSGPSPQGTPPALLL